MEDFKEKGALLFYILIYRLPARFFLIGLSFVASFFGLLSPLFQKAFVDALTGQERMQFFGIGLSSNALLNMCLAFLASLLSQFLSTSAVYYGAREGFFIQKHLGSIIYKKMLSLRRDTMNHRSIGEVISIYATDVASATTLLEQTLPSGAGIIFPIVMAPLFIHKLYDVPLLPTLLTMAFLVVFHLFLSIRQARFFFNFKQLAAERSGLVNEWIQNLRSLRILAWTKNFEKKIFSKRIEETKNRIDMVTNGQINSSVASSVSFFINLSAMISVIYFSHHAMTPGELLALLWVFGVFLTRPFRVLPWVMTFAFDSYSSIKRIELFLQLGDASEKYESPDLFYKSPVAIECSSPSLKISGLNLKLQDQKILDNFNLEIKAGEFLAVVGEVGSGKSLFLYSLLREVDAQFEEFKIGDQDILQLRPEQAKDYFTFVAQDAFVMSSNLRENIAFEYLPAQGIDDKVFAALQQAEFDPANESLNNGLDTEIGERGVNLSGGQRQRVGLARAVYFDRPIVLLDDSLSAVDVDTERKLVQNLLLGTWKNRTRILVSHRLSVLAYVDRIVFIEAGKISEIGTLPQLMSRSASFRNFTASARELRIETLSAISEFEGPSLQVADVDRGAK